MPFFAQAGPSLHYLVRGRGETVLLIHGLGSSGADWAFQVSALESSFQVIVPDLPGCGHSAMQSHRPQIESFAASLWALMDHLQVQQVNIVGFSLGGAVALEMALQRPACVPRLALINSQASYHIDSFRKWLEARVPALLIPLLGMARIARLSAARLFPETWQGQLRERAISVIGAVSAPTYLGLLKALEAWSCTARLGQLQARTLLLSGEHDYAQPAERSALAAALQASTLTVLGSSHGTPFDSVRATNAGLIAFLTDISLPATSDWQRDQPLDPMPWPGAGSIAEEHAAGHCA
jgi:3-oxoadipate enol-lactonase